MKNSVKDNLDLLIEKNMTETSSYYTFNSKQGKYRITFLYKYSNGTSYEINTARTIITLIHHNHKIAIGSRITFETYEDAIIAAEIYNKTIQQSTTSWNVEAVVY